MFEAYNRIFKRCGLDFLSVEADSGIMGGNVSHEFMVPASCGEDVVLVCPKCKTARPFKEAIEQSCAKCNAKLEKVNSIEVGHIFKLGTKYSSVLGAQFLDAKGVLKPVIMGCYGIGVSRLVSTIIEQNNDSAGIIWPSEITPYHVIVMPLDVTDPGMLEVSKEIHGKLTEKGFEVLLDDRDERAGVKFKDADLIGVPLQLIIGKESLKKNALELKNRRSQEKMIQPPEKILEEIERFYEK
jgi:prolyl-tRNA synthetase